MHEVLNGLKLHEIQLSQWDQLLTNRLGTGVEATVAHELARFIGSKLGA